MTSDGPKGWKQQFARVWWQTRWNDGKGPVAIITDMRTSGDGESRDLKVVSTMFGTMYIEKSDLPYLRQSLQATIELIEKSEGK